jgi:hypothetical protein
MMTKEKLESWITRCIAKEAGLRPHDIDAEAPLVTYMLNGFQSCRVVADLGAIVGTRLPESVLYSRPTIAQLAQHLTEQVVRKRTWAASIQKIYLGPLSRIAEGRPSPE